MSGAMAPGFRLTDQFGAPVSLSQFRGKEVVWAFIDDKCTTICPLTAQILTQAVTSLGPGAARLQMIAVNANPLHPSVAAVRAWSMEHQMMHRWLFLTGDPATLRHIYAEYSLADSVVGSGANAAIVHDPAVLILDSSGRERLYFDITPASPTQSVAAEISGLAAGMRQWLPSPAPSAT